MGAAGTLAKRVMDDWSFRSSGEPRMAWGEVGLGFVQVLDGIVLCGEGCEMHLAKRERRVDANCLMLTFRREFGRKAISPSPHNSSREAAHLEFCGLSCL
jgi:hypothetical protein